jgi:hypothetical protein
MDAKITLSFNKNIIEKAKQYAESQNISLSRMLELILDKITSNQYASIEDFPISDWVNEVAEGKAEYISTPKSNKKLRAQYYNRKK